MLAWDTVKAWTKEVALTFNGLAGSALDTPIIGNWCYVEFNHIYSFLMKVYIGEIEVGRWLDDAQARLAQILSWGTIHSYILGTWSWLNTIDDKIWWRARDMVRAYWSWLDNPISYLWGAIRTNILANWAWLNTASSTIWGWILPQITARWSWLDTASSTIWSWIRPQILGTWAWLNTIDDKIITTATARWRWLNTIDDKIRTVAWDYVMPKLGDWLLSWLMLNLTLWGRIAYRVLDKIWNMEWDDDRKEVK